MPSGGEGIMFSLCPSASFVHSFVRSSVDRSYYHDILLIELSCRIVFRKRCGLERRDGFERRYSCGLLYYRRAVRQQDDKTQRSREEKAHRGIIFAFVSVVCCLSSLFVGVCNTAHMQSNTARGRTRRASSVTSRYGDTLFQYDIRTLLQD